MDINDTLPIFKYVEFECELQKFGVRGILDVHHLPRMVLVTFSELKWYGANHLQAYIEECLMPLIKPGRKMDGMQEGGSRSMVADTQEVEGICKLDNLDTCSDVAVEDSVRAQKRVGEFVRQRAVDC